MRTRQLWRSSASRIDLRIHQMPQVMSGFRTEEGLTIEQALRAYTADAAKALGIADRIGSIEVGKNADLVVLDRNPLEMTATPEALPDVPVRMTIASGTVVFEDRKTASMAPVAKGTIAVAGKSVSGAPALPGGAQD
jgi:cytosine/adenosine deaminase-related metal-dependent hydrolase